MVMTMMTITELVWLAWTGHVWSIRPHRFGVGHCCRGNQPKTRRVSCLIVAGGHYTTWYCTGGMEVRFDRYGCYGIFVDIIYQLSTGSRGHHRTLWTPHDPILLHRLLLQALLRIEEAFTITEDLQGGLSIVTVRILVSICCLVEWLVC